MKKWLKAGFCSLFFVAMIVFGQLNAAGIRPVQADSGQGQYIVDGRYVSVTEKNAVAWSSFEWKGSIAKGAALYHKVFLSRGLYHHTNGNTYLSLYDHEGNWFGYINQKAVAETGQQGLWSAANTFATLTQDGKPIYTNFSGKPAWTSDATLGQTYRVTGEYHWFDGTVYASLYNSANQWQGYMRTTDVTLANVAQGVWQTKNGWAKDSNSKFQLWTDFSFNRYNRAQAGEVFKINGQYHHSNGSIYYSVYSPAGQWRGYINATALELISRPTGDEKVDNRYVTLKSGAAVYSDFNDTPMRGTATARPNHTYHSVGKSERIDGQILLKLQDSESRFAGYVFEDGVSVGTGPQGAWMPASEYTTFDHNATTYTDFSLTKVTGTPQSLGTVTLKITGQYRTFSGQLIYSVYDQHNRWLGYIDAAKVNTTASQAGLKLAQAGYFTTTKKGQPMWWDFGYKKSQNTNSHFQQTYQIRGRYVAFNGSSYYSLFDHKGSWGGYINTLNGSFATGAQGAWMSNSARVILDVAGYPIWSGFFTNQVGTTQKLLNKVYSATGKYRHYNGSLYYSLYDGKNWIGYVNAAATHQSGWRSNNGQLKYFDVETNSFTKTFSLKYYSQLDTKWANRKYSEFRLGPTGCGMASMAMIISGFGKAVTPAQTADYAHKYGTFDSPGGAGSLESDLTMTAEHFGLNWRVMSSANELTQYLKQGYPATVCINLPGATVRHIVVLTGYSNGMTTVHDPWSNLLFSGKHSVSEVWSKLSWLAGNKNKGASAAVVYIGK